MNDLRARWEIWDWGKLFALKLGRRIVGKKL